MSIVWAWGGLSSSSALAGSYQVGTYGGKSGLNTSHSFSIAESDIQYYSYLFIKYHLNTTIAMGGYAISSSWIKVTCNGVDYVSGNKDNNYPQVPANKSYQDDLKNASNNCASGTGASVSISWGGWLGPSFTLSNTEVWGVKNPPVANAHSINVAQNGSASNVTFNASDPQGIPITLHLNLPPSHGSVTISGDKFTYTPDSCYSGSDSFTYYAKETWKGEDSSPATVSITVQPQVPSLDAIANVKVPWYRPSTINLSGIGVSNGCGGSVTVTASSSNPSILPHPVVNYSSGATGSLTLTPSKHATQRGSATVTVTVNNGTTQTAKTFDVTVERNSLLRH